MHKKVEITHLYGFFEPKKRKDLALILKKWCILTKKYKKHRKKACYFDF